MSSSQPLCTAFLSKSSGKYLQCHVDDNQLLHLSGGDAVTPYTRFCVEPSTKHDGLVHIRCCYNNKYWFAQQHPNDDEWWIAGGANEPEEDLSLQSCTLFQLKSEADDTNNIRFIMHCQQGKHCGILADSKRANGSSLHVGSEEESEQFTLVTLLPWVLPKHVCFTGDLGLLLTVQTIGGIRMLVFSGRDMEDPDARFTTFHDGKVIRFRTRHQGLGLFWRRRAPIPTDPDDWILADFSGTSDPEGISHFEPFFFRNDLFNGNVSLRSMANNLYCRRMTKLPITDSPIYGLAAMESDPLPARMRWEEPLVSREVSVLQFNLGPNSTVYDEKKVTLATASTTNLNAVPMRQKLTFEFTLKETRRWSSSMTLKSDVVQTTISSLVPSMVDRHSGIVSGLDRLTGAMYIWGSVIEKTSVETVVQFVYVPGRTKVTATLSAVTSRYDVPFTYLQADALIGGANENFELDDGLYSGQNTHSFEYKYQSAKA